MAALLLFLVVPSPLGPAAELSAGTTAVIESTGQGPQASAGKLHKEVRRELDCAAAPAAGAALAARHKRPPLHVPHRACKQHCAGRCAVLQVLEGQDALWELPPGKPRGLLFVAHGCQHQATDFWPASDACKECLGGLAGHAPLAARCSSRLLPSLPHWLSGILCFCVLLSWPLPCQWRRAA